MNPGDVVLQRNSFSDPFSILIWVRSHRYGHCGVYIGQGKMIACDLLQGGVCLQDAGASDSHSVPVSWDFNAVLSWLTEQLDARKKYDLWAWVRILFGLRSDCPGDRFTCSSLVGEALTRFAGKRCYRETTPDEIAALLSA